MKTKFILLSILIFASIYAKAINFTVDDITYNTTSINTVEVSRGYNKTNTITIPSEVNYNSATYTVTKIGSCAFEANSYLNSITIPNTIIIIDSAAFFDCSNLESINIPNSIIKIENMAFNGCKSLTTVTIPKSVMDIGETSFIHCTNLGTINVDYLNPNYCSVLGVLFNKTKTELIAFPAGKSATNYTIPNTVTRIGSWAFISCISLSSITIPNSVTSIGTRAFMLCANLSSIIIPNSVVNIEFIAFLNCKSLVSIIVDNENPNYTSVNGVLFNKDKTVLLEYPAGKSATDYAIPNSVSRIETAAFYNCQKLISISIPYSVIDIEDWAFYSCINLNKIQIYKTQPIDLTSYYWVFFGINNTECKLYVPRGSREAYQFAFGWMNFINIIEDDAATGIANVNPNKSNIVIRNNMLLISSLSENEVLTVIDLKGKVLYSQVCHDEKISIKLPSSGVYLVKAGNRIMKVINQ